MDKSKNIPDMLCFKTLWALCCFEWAGYYTLMMLFYSRKILLEYISDRLVSCRNLSLDFGTFLTHHWKLEDPRTYNVSRNPLTKQLTREYHSRGYKADGLGDILGCWAPVSTLWTSTDAATDANACFGLCCAFLPNHIPNVKKCQRSVSTKFIQAAISEHPKRLLCYGFCQ